MLNVDVDRIELDDGGELGRDAVADQFADRDQMLADDTVERRQHHGVAQVGLGDRQVAFLVFDVGPCRIALGLGDIEGRLRRHVLPQQRLLARELGFRLHQGGLGGGELGLRFLDLRLVHRLFNHEQRVAFLHEGAVGVLDVDEEALDAGDEVDGGE